MKYFLLFLSYAFIAFPASAEVAFHAAQLDEIQKCKVQVWKTIWGSIGGPPEGWQDDSVVGTIKLSCDDREMFRVAFLKDNVSEVDRVKDQLISYLTANMFLMIRFEVPRSYNNSSTYNGRFEEYSFDKIQPPEDRQRFVPIAGQVTIP